MLDWQFPQAFDAQAGDEVTDSIFRPGPWETDTVETYSDGPALPPHPEGSEPRPRECVHPKVALQVKQRTPTYVTQFFLLNGL